MSSRSRGLLAVFLKRDGFLGAADDGKGGTVEITGAHWSRPERSKDPDFEAGWG